MAQFQNDRGEEIATLINGGGRGRVLLVCEHASCVIPREFGTLGLSAAERISHIAWDPGALALARAMSAALDAPLLSGAVSRLIYDCNRPPDAPDAIPQISEATAIPGNTGLSAAARNDRVTRFYRPFQAMLAHIIATAAAPPVLVTVHSFTPTYLGVPRDTQLGVLHDSDSRLADAMLALPPAQGPLCIRRNDPYGPSDGVTHTLREHGLQNGLLNVMLEIRNDLIATPAGQREMAARLCRLLTDALTTLDAQTRPKDPACPDF